MRRIAVIFPGVGYTKDRPLLYYAGKQAVKCGYELVHIDFSRIEWSKEKLKDSDFLRKVMERCLKITEDSLAGFGDMGSDDILFISKSIGTVVATAYAKKNRVNAKQICFSPLEMIEGYVHEEGAVLFCANADPFAEYEILEGIAKEKKLEMHCIEGGNHSLETGDPCTDIDNLKQMIERVEDLIR